MSRGALGMGFAVADVRCGDGFRRRDVKVNKPELAGTHPKY